MVGGPLGKAVGIIHGGNSATLEIKAFRIILSAISMSVIGRKEMGRLIIPRED